MDQRAVQKIFRKKCKKGIDSRLGMWFCVRVSRKRYNKQPHETAVANKARISAFLEEELHRRYKAILAERGQSMTEDLIQHVVKVTAGAK